MRVRVGVRVRVYVRVRVRVRTRPGAVTLRVVLAVGSERVVDVGHERDPLVRVRAHGLEGVRAQEGGRE